MKRLCKNKYWKFNEEYNTNKILYLLVDRPTYSNCYNDFHWKNNKGQWHRKYDLPAIVRCDGSKEYYINGEYTLKQILQHENIV